ncbi:MAG: hypothetical protein ACE5EH_12165 [Gammaproteobacteria bacterium]
MSQSYYSNEDGFSYIEVLASVLLVAILLLPAIESIQSGIETTSVNTASLKNHMSTRALLEILLAQPFTDLENEAVTINSFNTPSATYSDPAGTANRRLVYLSRYDGDNADADDNPFTGVDANLVWLRVEIENTSTSLETLTAP